MIKQEYKDYPNWMKTNMATCICGGKTVLFYDEYDEYHVECTDCNIITKIKAINMIDAKAKWSESENCTLTKGTD